MNFCNAGLLICLNALPVNDNAFDSATDSFAVSVELPDTSLYVASSIHTSLELPSVDMSAPNDAPKSSIVEPV